MNEPIDLLNDADQEATGQEVIEVKDADEEESVEVDEEAEERKRRKRRLKQLLDPNATPSFIAIITGNYEEHLLKRIRVDVNGYLGLKRKPKIFLKVPPRAPLVPSFHLASLPKDEGYYEGVIPVALPDDNNYMNELHLLIRHQLEIFSATDDDVNTVQPGRRTPTVRGKVGVRCVHCAKVALAHPPATRSWPPGAVSYPVNVEGLYSVCTQKPKLHFETCPNMPDEIKGHLYRLTHDAGGNSLGRQNLNNVAHMFHISAVNYYLIAAKRVGLVNVAGGIRFGRDLSLDPLSVESVRAEVEAKASVGKITSFSSPLKAIQEIDQPRIPADDQSEKVLAEALAEKDSELIIGRSDDSKLVTDFIFLCVRQMAFCHCVPADFESRGKKTALMRLGFAGFCCRHCSDIENPEKSPLVIDFSCRSFTSAADNISSAITGSFYGHLQKCYRVPIEIRKALAAYKRIHSRQIARLPHGSQRRLFQAIWARLRAADVSEEEMKKKLESAIPPTTQPTIESVVESSTNIAGPSLPDPIPSTESVPDEIPSLPEESTDYQPCYPPCDDEETGRLLKALEEDTDYASSDNLVHPGDRPLITDYVYFMMRNMKIAIPSSVDFTRGRRSTALNTKLAGFACKYCHGQDASVAASGRSFPSQADNMASSLNTTFYNHMLRCYYVPDNIKRAVANLKRIHSQQCSNLRFGSQRRFFNRVYQRLQNVKIPDFDIPDESRSIAEGNLVSDDERLTEFNFYRISPDLVECSVCRRIPLSLRAPNAVSTSAVNADVLATHKESCNGHGYYLGRVVDAMSKIMDDTPTLNYDSLNLDSYKLVIQELVGESLCETFTSEVLNRVLRKRGETSSNGDPAPVQFTPMPTDVDFNVVATRFEAWAKDCEGLESSLRGNKLFLHYFQVMAPAFVIPTLLS